MSRIPNAWDDDDWTPPSSSATTTTSSTPTIRTNKTVSPAPPTLTSAPAILLASQQPKTLYKPDLQILKRIPSPSATNSSASQKPPHPGRETIERERRERERHYQEVKDRIFSSSLRKPASTAPKKTQQSPPTSKPTTSPSLPATGAITSISLNSGTISAGPVVRQREEWQLRQVALDGKMLESQAAAYGLANATEEGVMVEGDGRGGGLDWDEFRRDQWDGGRKRETEEVFEELEERLEKLELTGGGNKGGSGNGTPKSGEGTPVRAPRGPDAEGRGFSGRGRGPRRRDD